MPHVAYSTFLFQGTYLESLFSLFLYLKLQFYFKLLILQTVYFERSWLQVKRTFICERIYLVKSETSPAP